MPPGYIETERRKLLERLARKHADARHERDVAIMEAVEAGISGLTISKIIGINASTVLDIARRKREELAGMKPKSRKERQVPGRPAPPIPRQLDGPPADGWERVD